MVLTTDEKEKLLNKATDLYKKILNVDIRDTIKIDLVRKYYPSNSRYTDYGFRYYFNKSMSCFGENIKEAIEHLKNYINYKKYNGEQYINGKSVDFISQYEIHALLDFIYNSNLIVETINEENNRLRKDLNNLLN